MSSSPADNGEDRNCALCLSTLPQKYDSKVCKKCFEKHNSHSKYASYSFLNETNAKENCSKSNAELLPENYCNLCKKSYSNLTELEEHLIEHSFRGCEERGYNCYICSAIFTLPSGLHQHMIEHGPTYRPYDCNLCAKKFYFRAELENHLIDHETGRIGSPVHGNIDTLESSSRGCKQMLIKHENNQTKVSNNNENCDREKNSSEIKSEDRQYSSDGNDDDDEYIEVEKIAESVCNDGEPNNPTERKTIDDDEPHVNSYGKDNDDI